ncbi:MAG TPA: ABC transporter permease, partial [Acidimicrobiia bacterium]|nr:ABC transporter permease [Acidimicrobiia bacterium]
AAVLALAALLVLGPVAFRLGGGERAGLAVLRALGLRPRELTWVALAPPVFASAVAAVVGGLGAVAASGSFPIGPGRRAEPHPGVHADLAVILPGVVLVAAVVLVAGGLAATQAARRAGRPVPIVPEGRRSISARLAGLGLPPAALVGVRAAFEPRRTGRGRGAAVALAGPVGAVVAVTAALVFGATLDRFVTTPARYGWTWDALVDTYESGAPPELIQDVRRDPTVAGVTVGGRGTVTLAGRSVPAVGLDPRGSYLPPPRDTGTAEAKPTGATPATLGPLPALSAGRWPQQAGEVALAAGTMRALHVGVGDLVTASGADGQPVEVRVVGRTVLPGFDPTQVYPLSEGAGFTPEGLDGLAGFRPSFFLVDLPHGRSPDGIKALTARFDQVATVFPTNPPGDVRSYDELGGTPLLLAGIIAALGAGVVANALFGSLRRRRRETAVLRALGFVARQTVTAVVTESLALVGGGLAVGLPLGVVGGRLAWHRFADALGTGGGPVVPVGQLALLVAGAAAG